MSCLGIGCYRGKNCIVSRREFHEWVYEDWVFQKAGLSLRKDCEDVFTIEQQIALEEALHGIDPKDFYGPLVGR